MVPPQFLSQSQMGSHETGALWLSTAHITREEHATSNWKNRIFEVKIAAADLGAKFTGWSLLQNEEWARNRIL